MATTQEGFLIQLQSLQIRLHGRLDSLDKLLEDFELTSKEIMKIIIKCSHCIF